MGLVQADTTDMVAALGETMRQVNAAILGHGGFSTRMMPAYAVHAYDDPAIDPRPTGKCNAFMRTYCRPDSPNRNNTFTYVNTSAIRVQYSDECVDLRPGAQRHRRPHSNRGRATPFTLHLGSRGQADGLCTALIVLTVVFLASTLLQSNISLGDMWLKGMADGAASSNRTVQYCMPCKDPITRVHAENYPWEMGSAPTIPTRALVAFPAYQPP